MSVQNSVSKTIELPGALQTIFGSTDLAIAVSEESEHLFVTLNLARNAEILTWGRSLS